MRLRTNFVCARVQMSEYFLGYYDAEQTAARHAQRVEQFHEAVSKKRKIGTYGKFAVSLIIIMLIYRSVSAVTTVSSAGFIFPPL